MSGPRNLGQPPDGDDASALLVGTVHTGSARRASGNRPGRENRRHKLICPIRQLVTHAQFSSRRVTRQSALGETGPRPGVTAPRRCAASLARRLPSSRDALGPVRTTIGLDNTSEGSATRGRQPPDQLRKARLPRGFRTPAILHHQRRAADPAARHRPGRDTRMDRVVRYRRADQGPGARQVRHAPPARAGARAAGRGARPAQHRLHQHDPARARAVVPRRRARRAPDQGLHQVERRRHGLPREPARHGRGRAHRDLRQRGLPVRGRLQPLLPRQGPRRVRRPGVLPGARGAGHLRPRLPGGPADRGPAQRVPPGALAPGRRAAVLPAPAADAGLLGVPHGVDGARRAELHLPGPVQPVPAGPRDPRHLAVARVGVPRRRRDGRAGGARRDRPGRPRGTGQPHLRHQLQPAAAGRPGARQRQDHPGARGVSSAARAGT